jgi:hypothetical protein
MGSRPIARGVSFFVPLLVALAFALTGCATGMKMTKAELEHCAPNEGRVLGSVHIQGGKDLLGLTGWALVAESPDASFTDAGYSVEADRDGEEVVFLTKMPAGAYCFTKMVKTGFSNFEAGLDVPFTVEAGKTTYLGQLLIQFPSGLITVGEEIHWTVSDDRAACVARAEREYGLSLADVSTHLMGGGDR